MSRLLSLAFLPACVLLAYVYHMDTIEKEPFKLLLHLFLLGGLCALPASILETVGARLIAPLRGTWLHSILNAFCVVAIAEEGCKFAILCTTWDHPAFDYRFDAIVYAVSVSLGFATVENIGYVLRYGFVTGIFRAVTSVPGHCFFGVFMGYWFGTAKYTHFYGFSGHRRQRALSAVVPMLLHGFYDFCCFMSSNLSFVFLFYIFLVGFFSLSLRCVRKASACDTPVRRKYPDFPISSEVNNER